MGKQLGACGLDCASCEAFIATKNNDPQEIARIAEVWSKQFEADIHPEHIWCDGCISTSERKCAHCSDCEIRACSVKNGLDNCALCKDYPCAQLSEFLAQVPVAKANLEEVRSSK